MSSRHLVDPELLPLIEAMPTLTLSAENLGVIREARKAMLAQLPPFPESVAVEERHIQVRRVHRMCALSSTGRSPAPPPARQSCICMAADT